MYLSICYDRNDHIIAKLYSLNFPSRQWFPKECVRVKAGLSATYHDELSNKKGFTISAQCIDITDNESWETFKEKFR